MTPGRLRAITLALLVAALLAASTLSGSSSQAAVKPAVPTAHAADAATP